MTPKNPNWKSLLADLFGATVNQDTLEEAAALMASNSVANKDYHLECLAILDDGIHAAQVGDSSVIDCIHESGYTVSSLPEAVTLLKGLRELYLADYQSKSL